MKDKLDNLQKEANMFTTQFEKKEKVYLEKIKYLESQLNDNEKTDLKALNRKNKHFLLNLAILLLMVGLLIEFADFCRPHCCLILIP